MNHPLFTNQSINAQLIKVMSYIFSCWTSDFTFGNVSNYGVANGK